MGVVSEPALMLDLTLEQVLLEVSEPALVLDSTLEQVLLVESDLIPMLELILLVILEQGLIWVVLYRLVLLRLMRMIKKEWKLTLCLKEASPVMQSDMLLHLYDP